LVSPPPNDSLAAVRVMGAFIEEVEVAFEDGFDGGEEDFGVGMRKEGVEFLKREAEEFGVEGGYGGIKGLAEGWIEEEGVKGGGLELEGLGDVREGMAREEGFDDLGVVRFHKGGLRATGYGLPAKD